MKRILTWLFQRFQSQNNLENLDLETNLITLLRVGTLLLASFLEESNDENGVPLIFMWCYLTRKQEILMFNFSSQPPSFTSLPPRFSFKSMRKNVNCQITDLKQTECLIHLDFFILWIHSWEMSQTKSLKENNKWSQWTEIVGYNMEYILSFKSVQERIMQRNHENKGKINCKRELAT